MLIYCSWQSFDDFRWEPTGFESLNFENIFILVLSSYQFELKMCAFAEKFKLILIGGAQILICLSL